MLSPFQVNMVNLIEQCYLVMEQHDRLFVLCLGPPHEPNNGSVFEQADETKILILTFY